MSHFNRQVLIVDSAVYVEERKLVNAIKSVIFCNSFTVLRRLELSSLHGTKKSTFRDHGVKATLPLRSIHASF